jgi:four helix bundle protein
MMALVIHRDESTAFEAIEMALRDFRELRVWERAHLLTVDIYRSTEQFPKSEQFGLTSQIRRAAVSVPTNIAEGCGRGSRTELARFCQIAMGSASELEYLLLLAHEVRYLEPDDYDRVFSKTIEVKKMLSTFITRLRASG